jgi:hypothetical protein
MQRKLFTLAAEVSAGTGRCSSYHLELPIRLLSLFLAFALASCTSRTAPPVAKTQTEAAQLVEELVSRFPPAQEDGDSGMGGGPVEDTPRRREALRVRNAYDRLKSMGAAAFDDLVAASDDGRYSFSKVYAALRNHSVGDACFMILESQVDTYGYGYKSRDGANGEHAVKPQYLWHVRETEGLKHWWENRGGLGVRALQIESITWTIAKEEEIGFVNQQQRQEVLGPLEKRLKQLGGRASP